MRDQHVHSPYCPHGSTDTLEAYVHNAKKHNLREISFTEHAPLPQGFIDPTPLKDSAMSWSDLPQYLKAVQLIKEKYKRDIKVNVGLEIDYIEGFEHETRAFLDEYGLLLDDSILSVHFIKKENNYYCIDYSEDNFHTIIQQYGNIRFVYDKYFDTLKKSILSDLGPYKPTRIGHITLVEKFKKKYPAPFELSSYSNTILDLIVQKKYSLDYNGAGIVKPLCGETYPPLSIATEAAKRKIPLIYGSDAHSAKDLMQGYAFINSNLLIEN